MIKLSNWKVVEIPSEPRLASEQARRARDMGAVGAVTSWGSGMIDRHTLRVYWQEERADQVDGEVLSEEDWRATWRETLRPYRAGKGFFLAPPWDETPAPEGLTRLTIDPGMAFGAGDHPTTRLCVSLLEAEAAGGDGPVRLLDVGAGTGVLSLVWATLGGSADALDIDPFCFASCERNVSANGAEGFVRPLLASLDLLDESYRLVVANVVPSQLTAMAPRLAQVSGQGSRLILSGFEKDSEKRVIEAFSDSFAHLCTLEEEGWLALLFSRRPGPVPEGE